ncbi:MAG: hypothetical protein II690_04665 [Ruminococcus sp.]|nr:hypothetical protein [Ruminococcus sp.]MBQ3915866.1 hypothetical protein [Ruminococcus sp.]
MKKRIIAKVYCRKNTYGTLDFFLDADSQAYYLFTTNYYSQVIHDEYHAGRMVDNAFRKSRSVREQKLRERIIRMTRYMENENDMTIFQRPDQRPVSGIISDDDYEIA